MKVGDLVLHKSGTGTEGGPGIVLKVYDYRFVKVLRNSLLHSKTMKASKKNPKQKAAARVGRPGTVTQRKTTTSLKKAQTRLRKSGKVKDAAKVFEQII